MAAGRRGSGPLPHPRWILRPIPRGRAGGQGSAIARPGPQARVLLLDLPRLLEDAVAGVLEREGFEVLRADRGEADVAAVVDRARADALLVAADGPAAGRVCALLARRPDLRALALAGDGRLLLLPLAEASPASLVRALRGVVTGEVPR